MPGKLSDLQDGFAGGWNLTPNGRLLPSQYAAAFNMRLTGDGDIQPRQGSRRCTAAALVGAQAIVNGFSWRRADGSVLELMVAADGSLWKGTYSDAGAVPTLSGVATLAVAGKLHNAGSLATFRTLAGLERVYIADGANGLSYTDGAAFGDHTVGPPAIALQYIWVYNHRLYGIPANGEVIYFSALDDGDSLGVIGSGGGFATVRTFGGQQLTGGLAIGSTNVLFHRGALSMFRGLTNDDITIDTGSVGISSVIGMPSPAAATILEITNALAFAHTNLGAAMLTGAAVRLLDQADRPDPLINDPAYPSGFLAAAQAVGAPLFVIRNTRFKEIWFGALGSLPVYVYSYLYGCWVGKLDFHAAGAAKPIRAIWETKTPSGGTQLLYGSTDGFVRTLDAAEGSSLETYLDDVLQNGTGGSAYAWSVSCRRFWTENRRARKQWTSAALTARFNGASIGVTVTGQKGDNVTTTVVSPSSIVMGDYVVQRLTDLPKSTQCIDVVLGAATATPPPAIAAFETDADVVGDRPLVHGDAIDVTTFWVLDGPLAIYPDVSVTVESTGSLTVL